MTNEKHNGWTNYETWNVNLWLDQNREYYIEVCEEMYKTATADKVFTQKENAVLAISNELKNEFEDNAPELEGTYADLLNAALCEVNWHEIAQGLVDEMQN